MRFALTLFAVGIAAIGASAAEPKDVIELAIKAHGGKDALAKAKVYTQKVAGTMTAYGTELEFAGDVACALPDRYRLSLSISQPGTKLLVTQTVNAGKVKSVVDGKARPLPEGQKKELLQQVALNEISLLLALKDETKYTLKSGTDAKVGEIEAAAVVVSGKDIADVTLLFDKKTSQLVQTKRSAIGPDDKPADEETTLSEFKKFDGVLLPTKLVVTRGGKKFMTATVSDFKWLDKADDKTFAVDD